MLNFLLGVWQFVLVWGVGFALMHRAFAYLPYGYRVAIAFGLGETVLSYAYFTLGLFGGLRFWVLVPAAVLGTVLLTPIILSETKRITAAAWTPIKRSPLASSVTLILLTIYTLAACVPEREVDSIWYHLATPLYYITHGGAIQLVPFNMPSHYPMNVHLHYTFSLLVGNDTTCKVFILLHFIPMLILLWSVVKRYANASWGLFAIAIYLCCLHFRLPVMVNVQRAVYFYVFLSTVLLWLALEKKNHRLFILAAVFCGMAMGTKFNGLLFGLVPQGLFLVWQCLIRRKMAWREKIFKLCAYPVIAVLMMSPWLIKSAVYTHNPLYPMLGELFPTKAEFIPAMNSNDNNHGLNPLKSESVGEFIGQVEKNLLWVLYEADLIFLIGLLAVGFLLAARLKRWRTQAVYAGIVYGLFTMLWGSDIARLFAVNYGVVTLTIALAVSFISRRIERPALLASFLILSLFATFLQQRYYYLSSPNINWFGGVYLSEAARRDWLAERRIFSRDMFRMKDWIDANVPVEEELYGFHTGYLFYLDRKNIVCGAHFGKQGDPLERWMNESGETAYRHLRELNVEWLLFAESPYSDVQRALVSAEWESFQAKYLESKHWEGTITLFKLK